MKPKAIIVSGYFNPIHKGHIEYFNNAKALGDYLIIIVNNASSAPSNVAKNFNKKTIACLLSLKSKV
jgi:cytidyltransferase-like protein